MTKKTSKKSKIREAIPHPDMKNKSLKERYQDILERGYYSLVAELSKKEDYKGLEDLIEKIHEIDKDFPLIEQLLSSIILDHNQGKSILSTSEHCSQDYSKVAKKLGLKKILKLPNKTSSSVKDKERNLNPPAPVIEKELRRINSEYQSLLIKILELKPQSQKRIMKINNFSSNYSTPLIAKAYNYHNKTEDIDGTIKRLKIAIKEEGYGIDAGISLARLYEIKEASSSLKHPREGNQAQKEWERLINHILNDDEVNFHTIQHCAPGNKVRKYVHLQQNTILKDYNGSTLIFKIGQKGRGLKREKEVIERLKRINNEKRLNLRFPEIKLFTQKGNLEYLIMSSPGIDTLSQSINSNPYQILTEIVGQIVKIHKHLPKELLKKTHSEKKEENRIHYSSRLKQKLFGSLKEAIKRKKERDDFNKKQEEMIAGNYGALTYDKFMLTKNNQIKHSELKKEYYSSIAPEELEKLISDYCKDIPLIKPKEEQTILSQSFEQKFFENYTAILDIISGLKKGVYKDASLKNWIRVYSGSEKGYDYVSIDYGTLRNSPFQFDLANAIESIDHSIPNYKNLLLKHYFALTKAGCLEEFEEFKKGYYACAIHKCLINIGNSLRFFLGDDYYPHILGLKEPSQQLFKDCKTFSNNAVWNINRLKDYYTPVSEEYHKLTNLESQLKIIENCIQTIAR